MISQPKQYASLVIELFLKGNNIANRKLKRLMINFHIKEFDKRINIDENSHIAFFILEIL